MLERACKMLADQFIGGAIIDTDSQNSQELVSKTPRNSSIDPLGFLLFTLKCCIFDLG